MTQVFISTSLTETFYFQANDEIFVTETGSILTDDFYGIINKFSERSGASVTVAGAIVADLAGVALYGGSEGETPSLISLVVGETGSLTSQFGALIVTDFDYDIRVAGRISGSAHGIHVWGDGSDGLINVSGLVEGETLGAIRLSGTAFFGEIETPAEAGVQTVVNTGVIRGVGDAAGVYASGPFYLEVVNTGRIEGALGVHVRALGAEIGNFGDIVGETNAIYITPNTPTTILNRGTLTGGVESVLVRDATVEIINSGVISGEIYADAGALNIHNTGTITGTDGLAISVTTGALDLYNSGSIHGDIVMEDVDPAHIANIGVIYGDVVLGDNDETYHARGTGYVTGEVFGGDGDDVLIGGDRSDRLRGGYDNDRLVGNGGRDDLQGGYGEDSLNGGANADRLDGGLGNDLLTGGTGADVFVFAAEGGTDRVRDFAQGVDLMEIDGQTGGFDALVIQGSGSDLEITYDGGIIVLVDQAGLNLSALDFDFI